LVDVNDLPTAISSHREGGGRYAAARLFLLRNGVPVGDVIVPFSGPVLSAETIAKLVAAADGRGDSAVSTARQPLPPGADRPFVSVVVASSFARPAMLKRCVDALCAQDYPHYEILVVDNRPHRAVTRDLAADLATMPRVRIISEPRPGASAARNRGYREARGEIIAFTDDDTAAAPNWLTRLVDRFQREPDADCVTGLVIPGELETPAQIWFEYSSSAFHQRYEPASYGGGPYLIRNRLGPEPDRATPIYLVGDFGTGSNMAFRRAALQRLGGFDEALGPGTPAHAGEEIQLFIRLLAAGGRLAFEPSMYVRHWHRRTVPELVRQLRGYGIGFTAMLTATVVQQPHHLRGLLGLRRGAAQAPGRPARAEDERFRPPKRLDLVRNASLMLGPAAYVWSRVRLRRWRR